MADSTGQRTTGNLASIQRQADLRSKVMRLEPDAAPLTVITSRLKGNREVTNNAEFTWLEKERHTRFDAVNDGTGLNSSDDTMVVDTGAAFKVGDLVKVPRTGEVVEVTAISTNSLTIVRGVGASSGAAMNDNEPLLILGIVAEEGGTSVQAVAKNPAPVSNYTQIFKRSVEISGTASSETNRSTPHDWTLQHEDEALEHLIDQEYAFKFGSKGTSTSTNGKPVRTTGGVFEFATQNNQDAGGTLTEAEFEQFLRNAFRYGSKNKTLFASPLLVSVLNTFSQTKIQTAVGDDTYGVSITKWISPHGVVNIVKDNLLEGATYGGYGLLLDFGRNNIKRRYVGGGPGGDRDTKLLKNRQANDRDGLLDEWITEVGLEFGQPKAHAVLTGVTG